MYKQLFLFFFQFDDTIEDAEKTEKPSEGEIEVDGATRATDVA